MQFFLQFFEKRYSNYTKCLENNKDLIVFSYFTR